MNTFLFLCEHCIVNITAIFIKGCTVLLHLCSRCTASVAISMFSTAAKRPTSNMIVNQAPAFYMRAMILFTLYVLVCRSGLMCFSYVEKAVNQRERRSSATPKHDCVTQRELIQEQTYSCTNQKHYENRAKLAIFNIRAVA